MRPQPRQVRQTFGSWSNASWEKQPRPCRHRGGLWKLQQAVMLLICNFPFVSRLILQSLMQKIAMLQDKPVLLLKNRKDFTAHPVLWFGPGKRNAITDQSFHVCILCDNIRKLCTQWLQSEHWLDILSLRLCNATELKRKIYLTPLSKELSRIVNRTSQLLPRYTVHQSEYCLFKDVVYTNSISCFSLFHFV